MVVQQWSEADVDRVFHAMADLTRRDILAQVMQREQSVSALARRYAMSFAAVQKHVAVLERAALVIKQRRGREQIVHGNVDMLLRARSLLDQYEDIWRHRSRVIGEILAEEGQKGREP